MSKDLPAAGVIRAAKRARPVVEQNDLIRSLRATLSKMELALGQLEDPIVFIDSHGRIEWCNDPFCALVERRKISVLGNRLENVLPLRRNGHLLTDSDYPAELALETEQPFVEVLEFAPADGRPRQLRVSGRTVMHSVDRSQGVFVFRDVTQEDQDFRQARLAMLGSLTSGMLHQIRSPLSFVRSNVEFLRSALESDQLDREEFLKVFDESVYGLDRIASLFQSVSSVHEPSLDRFEKFDLANAVREAARMAKGHWDTVADVQIPPDRGDAPVYGDPIAVAQAISQILVNAAWSVSERRRTQGSSFQGSIVVTLNRLDGWSELSVRDNGIGIQSENLGRIFEPFFTTRRGTDALGQGLFVAKTILVDQHGGTLEANESDEGAEFVVRLPSYERS